jgi:2-hydroxychromene-2-carboxylate isomerase
MTAIPFYIDLKSPYSYVAAHRGLALSREGKAEFDWLPFTLDIAGRAGGLGWQQRIRYVYRDVRRFATPLGLTIRGPKQIYDSTVAQIGMLYAKQSGVHEAYIEKAYALFFQRELEPGDPVAIRDLLDACGCDAVGFPAFLEDDGPRDLAAIQEEAVTAGVFGVPSLIVENELFWGQDRLDMALAQASITP